LSGGCIGASLRSPIQPNRPCDSQIGSGHWKAAASPFHGCSLYRSAILWPCSKPLSKCQHFADIHIGAEMIMLRIVAQASGLILGSLMAGILLWWLSFSLSKRCRHPKWGIPIIAPVLLIAFGPQIYRSEFVGLTLMFSVLICGLLWIVGDEWQRADSGVAPAKTSTDNRKSEAIHFRYTAIAACMSECRSPSRGEIRRVAKRMRSEAYPGQRLDRTTCRRISLAAVAALNGMAAGESGRATCRSAEEPSDTSVST